LTDAGRADPRLIEMFDRQSAAFFLSARDRPWAEVNEDGDVIWGTTGLPIAAFNGATNAKFSAADADERIEAILGSFRERSISMTWFVGPTSTPFDLVARLIGHGLAPSVPEPGMACSLEGWSPPPPAADVAIELVIDDAAFHEATRVMFAGFEMPEAVMPMFEERYRGFCVGPDAMQRVFLGRIDGQPVATSLGFVLDGVLGIYNVATIPEARRRGAGAAVTAAAMTDGRSLGAHTAILEASTMGRSMYEQLGFHEVCEVMVLSGDFGG
jgi:ribosomal protein S18 acetylase RimI-like enzyme